MGAHGQTAALLILEFHIPCKPLLATLPHTSPKSLSGCRIRIFAIADTAAIVCLLLIRSRRNQSLQSRRCGGSRYVIGVAVRRSAEKQLRPPSAAVSEHRSRSPMEPGKTPIVPVAEDPTELVWVVEVPKGYITHVDGVVIRD